jgi:hypothetical protein
VVAPTVTGADELPVPGDRARYSPQPNNGKEPTPMTSTSPRSVRLVAQVLLAAVVVGLGLAVASVVVPDHAAAADPIYACASRSDYSLRSPIPCTRLETLVQLNDNRHPVWVCLKPSTGVLYYAGNADSPITARCPGASSSQFVRLPGDDDTTLCVTTATGALSLPPCGPGQTPLVVPKRNNPPVAAPKSATVLEDGSVAITLSATDADGEVLTFAIGQPPTHGSLSGITGTSCTGATPNSCTASVTYTPAADYFGPDSFKYKANDGLADSALAVVSITVTGINDEPEFTSGGDVTVDEDSGAYNQPWATGVSAGPFEGSQALTFHVGNDNNALFSSQPAVSPSGALSFTPATNANGSAQATVYLTDDGGTANGGDDTSGSQTFTITVNAVNDRPTFQIAGNQTVAEDAGPQTVANFAFDFDPGPPDESGQTVLDYKVSTQQDALFSVQPDISDAGTLTYTPAPDATGVATISVRVQDNGGTANGGQDTSGPDPLTFTITISGVDDAPVNTVPGATQTTPEDTDLLFSSQNGNRISVADVDADPQDVQVTLTVTHGVLTLNTDNGLTFDPTGPDNNGVRDATLNFTGTVSAVNAALGVLTYSPDLNYNGPDTLTVTTDDLGHTGAGGPLADTDTVDISVAAVNDPPSFASAGGVTVLEDSGPASSVWATNISTGGPDESGQTLTFHLAPGNTTGTIAFDVAPSIAPDGTLTFTPAPDTNGTATFDVTLSDNGGGTDTSAPQTLTITVTAVNDAPSFALGGDQTVPEDNGPTTAAGFATGISAGPSDEGGQTLTFHVSNDNNALFSTQPDIDEATGDLTYTPAPDANGNATVTVSLSDDGGTANGGQDTSADQTFTITVSAVDDAPVLTVPSSAIPVFEDVPRSITGIAIADVDVGALDNVTLTLAVPSGQGTFDAGSPSSIFIGGKGTNTLTVTATLGSINNYVATGEVTFTTAPDAVADVTMTVTADDLGHTGSGGPLTDTETVTLDVTAVNDAPSFTSGGDVAIPPGTTDYSAQWATNILAGPPDEQATQTVHFEITGNTNPTLFESTGQPTISPTGVLSFTAVSGADGSSQITVVLKDDGLTANGGADTSAPVIFTIATNRPPTIADVGDQVIDEDTATGAIAVTVGDPDEGPNALVLSASSDNPTLLPPGTAYAFGGSGAARTLTITPAPNQNGSATVTVTVTDSGGLTATDTFVLTVKPVNDEPSFNIGGNQTVAEDAGNQTVAGFATGMSAGPPDEGGQTLTFHVANDNNALFSTQPDISPTTGDLTYTPAANANGSALVSVFLTDNGNNTAPNDNTSATKTFTITVTAVNDPPSFTSGGNVTGSEDTAYNAAWATAISPGPNESGQTLTFNVTNDNNALFSTQPAISSTGVLTFTPAANANGSAVVTVTLSDNGSNTPPNSNTSAPVTFTITVTAVNDAPVLSNLEATNLDFTENGSPIQLTAAIDVADVDNANLASATVAITSGFQSGADVLGFTNTANISGSFVGNTLTLTGSATLAQYRDALRAVTYQNTSDDPTGTDRVVTFTVDDGQAANHQSNQPTRTIKVHPVNDAPVVTGEPYTFAIDENTANATNVGTPITFTDPEAAQTHTFAITAGNTNNAFAINASSGQITVQTSSALNYEAIQSFSLTVTVTDNGTPTLSDTTTVIINLNDVNEPPVAGTDSYSAFGNTQLRISSPTSPATAVAFTTSGTSPKANDTDPDTLNPAFSTLQITAVGSCSKGGTLTLNAADHTSGGLVYLPSPGKTDTTAPAGADSCSYTLSDGTNTVTGTINVSVTNMVWYVQNTASSPGDTGTSVLPFNTLAEAQTASAANDIIYVLTGDGTNTGQNAGITLKNGQKLWGQGVPLVVGSTTLISAGTKPVVGNPAGNGVTVDASAASLTNVEIRGLSLSGSVNAIDVTASGSNAFGVTIDTNTITGAGQEGIDVNAGGSGGASLSIHDNSVTATGTAIDVTRTAGTTTITAFDDNVVTGTSAGAGIVVSGPVTFDANTGTAGIQQVSGGTTVIGASGAGNGVGTNGMVLTNVLGDLRFTDLDIFTDNGTGLQATSTGTFNLGVAAGVATITTSGGPALVLNTVAADLQLASITVNSSPSTGVSLTSVSGTVSAGSTSSIQSAAGIDFSVGSSTATVAYAGTINSAAGGAVDVTGHSSGTVTFSGNITVSGGSGINLSNDNTTIGFTGTLNLSTGASNAFIASNSSLQGTLSVNPVGTNTNALTTTTGTALSITRMAISANGVTFKSISAGTAASGPASGIVLNTTGSSGGLTIPGDGTNNGTGGLIQHTTSYGISLNSTQNVSLTSMSIQSTADSGIDGRGVTNFSFVNGTVNNSGNSDFESNIAFNGFIASPPSIGTGSNIAGTLTVTGSTLNNAYYGGVDVQANNGTVSNATITGNTFTSPTTDATSKGYAVNFVGTGTGSSTFNLTKATIANNTIRNFPSGGGIQVNTGNVSTTGTGATAGTPGTANIISITGNSIRGQSAANTMGTSAILVVNSGGNSGSRSVMNVEILNNGSAADRLSFTDGTTIGIGNNGYATMTATVSGNFIDSHNIFASQGIGGGNGVVLATGTETPDLTMTVSNNNIINTDGNGILLVGRGTAGIFRLKINSNSVAAPLGGVRPGIRVDAGNGNSTDDRVYLNIFDNTSAGSGISEGIGVRKEGTVSTTNDFGIFDATGGPTLNSPPTNAQVETFIEALNPSGGGAFVVNGDNFQRDTTQAPV